MNRPVPYCLACQELVDSISACPLCGGSEVIDTAPNPAFARRVKNALRAGLSDAGVALPPQRGLSVEHVKLTVLCRVTVRSEGFANMPHSKRQDLLWGIVRQRLGRAGELGITTIYALTPDNA